jgi:ribonuclease Z
VTSILFNFKSISKTLLLDCGEGSLGQIYRIFGEEEGDNLLKNMRLIWISHKHADHNLGTFKVLERIKKLHERYEIKEDDFLVCNISFFDYLKEFEESSRSFLDFKFISNESFEENEKTNDIKEIFNLTELYNVPVIHCVFSYGIIIKHKNNWKVTYSGILYHLIKGIQDHVRI